MEDGKARSTRKSMAALKASALKELESLRDMDNEVAHAKADKVLCDLLCALGFVVVVAAFEKIEKWYA